MRAMPWGVGVVVLVLLGIVWFAPAIRQERPDDAHGRESTEPEDASPPRLAPAEPARAESREEAEAEPSAEPIDDGSGTPDVAKVRRHVFIQIAAETDKTRYHLGEPIVIRRVFENAGTRPLEVKPEDWMRGYLPKVGVTSKSSSRLYDAAGVDTPSAVLQPGERVACRMRVELPEPGEYVIEVPPEYLARGGCGAARYLEVTVADRADPQLVAEKAKRLARAVVAEGDRDPRLWTEAHNDLERLGAAVVPHLRRWLRESESAHLRGVSAKLLQRVDGRDGVEELVQGLRDPDAQVRRTCVDTLGTFGIPETLDGLLPVLGDADEWVRVDAVQAVARFEDSRVGPALRERLSDAEASPRLWAAVSLAERKDPAGVPHLIAALKANPSMYAGMVVPALETVTGRSFGKPDHPFIYSVFEQIEEAAKRCEVLAEKWLAWWDDDGRIRYGDRR